MVHGFQELQRNFVKTSDWSATEGDGCQGRLTSFPRFENLETWKFRQERGRTGSVLGECYEHGNSPVH